MQLYLSVCSKQQRNGHEGALRIYIYGRADILKEVKYCVCLKMVIIGFVFKQTQSSKYIFPFSNP